MARRAYTGISNKARKVTKIYVGISNKARKVIKAYVGINGKAQQFFGYVDHKFIGSIAPTSWSGTGTAAGATFSASNTFGSWSLSCSIATRTSSNCAKYAVDNSTTTYLNLKQMSTTCNLDIKLPTDVTINATEASVTAKYINKNAKVYGYNGSWVSLGSPFSSNVSGTKTTKTLSISNTNYFSRFRISFESYSDQCELYDFKITKGTLRDNR